MTVEEFLFGLLAMLLFFWLVFRGLCALAEAMIRWSFAHDRYKYLSLVLGVDAMLRVKYAARRYRNRPRHACRAWQCPRLFRTRLGMKLHAWKHPDETYYRDDGDVYLDRWHVIPKNKRFNVYLHRFNHSDDDRAIHDHPWTFNASILLRGCYLEHTFDGVKLRRPGAIYYRKGKAPHRVELLKDSRGRPRPVWTLFISGRYVRRWGFYCPQGWRVSTEFHERGCE